MTKKDNKKYNVSIISNILTYYSYKNIKKIIGKNFYFLYKNTYL